MKRTHACMHTLEAKEVTRIDKPTETLMEKNAVTTCVCDCSLKLHQY